MNRWTVSYTRILEGLVKEAVGGSGMGAAEVLYLSADGSCLLNAVLPVHGDSVASSAIHGGGGGHFFGDLKFSSEKPGQVVGTTPLLITELSEKVLQFPYHLDLTNPMSVPGFAALHFLRPPSDRGVMFLTSKSRT